MVTGHFSLFFSARPRVLLLAREDRGLLSPLLRLKSDETRKHDSRAREKYIGATAQYTVRVPEGRRISGSSVGHLRYSQFLASGHL